MGAPPPKILSIPTALETAAGPTLPKSDHLEEFNSCRSGKAAAVDP